MTDGSCRPCSLRLAESPLRHGGAHGERRCFVTGGLAIFLTFAGREVARAKGWSISAGGGHDGRTILCDVSAGVPESALRTARTCELLLTEGPWGSFGKFPLEPSSPNVEPTE